MASKNSTSLAFFFTFNVLFFTLTASTDCGCNASPKPPIHVPNPMPPVHVPSPLVPSPKPPVHVPSPMPRVHVPSPLVPSPNPPVHVPSPMPPVHVPSPSVPSPNPPMYVPSPSVPSPNPKPVPPPSTPSSSRNCPIDVLKLGACGDILSGLLNLQLGQPSSQQCCSVVEGLVDLEAAVCLCTALRANIVLGINLDVSVSLSVLLNKCNRKVPSGFECT